MKKLPPMVKWGCLVPGVGVLLLVLAVLLLDEIVPSNARSALPKSASEIVESYDCSWNGDFTRQLSARLPEADYPTYAARLSLTARFDPLVDVGIANWINSGGNVRPDSQTYYKYRPGESALTTLNYVEGRVYLYQASW